MISWSPAIDPTKVTENQLVVNVDEQMSRWLQATKLMVGSIHLLLLLCKSVKGSQVYNLCTLYTVQCSVCTLCSSLCAMWVCVSVRECAKVWKSVQKCAKVCKSVQKCSNVCKSEQMCAILCWRKLGNQFARVTWLQSTESLLISHNTKPNANS